MLLEPDREVDQQMVDFDTLQMEASVRDELAGLMSAEIEEVSLCTFAFKYSLKGRYVWGIKSRPDYIEKLIKSMAPSFDIRCQTTSLLSAMEALIRSEVVSSKNEVLDRIHGCTFNLEQVGFQDYAGMS